VRLYRQIGAVENEEEVISLLDDSRHLLNQLFLNARYRFNDIELTISNLKPDPAT
jgi:hypothetical protein